MDALTETVQDIQDEESNQSLPIPTKRTQCYYPGDLVCYKFKRPFELTPYYGVILAPNNQFIRYVVGDMVDDGSKQQIQSPTTELENKQGPILPMKWSYETGLKGKLHVQWSHSNRIATVPDTDVSFVDRPVVNGQLVKNFEGNFGVVNEVSSRVTLQILNTNDVIESVPVEILNPISPFVRGREILYEGWIGVIIALKRSTTCRLDGGAVFNLTTVESDGFMKPDPYWSLGTPVPNARNKYPSTVMRNAKFESRALQFIHRFIPPLSYLYTKTTCTVIGVEVLSVDVKWLQTCPTSSKALPYEPPLTLDKKCFKKIKLLGIPSYDTVGMNSIRMYKYRPVDPVITYNNWISKFRYYHFGDKIDESQLKKSRNDSSSSSNAGKTDLLTDMEFEVPVKVIGRTTFVDILWDDGTKQRIPSTQIPYLVSPNSTVENGFPIGLVVQSVFDDGSEKYGVVQANLFNGNRMSQVISVRWILPTESDVLDLGLCDESLYDLEPHAKISIYKRGTLVFINDSQNLYEAGTVCNIDVPSGQVLVTVPEERDPVYLWPHQLTPMTQKCFWNFFSRTWTIDPLLLPLHQNLLEEGSGYPRHDTQPIIISTPNNNEAEIGTIWDLSKFDVLNHAPEVHKFYGVQPKNPTSEYTSFLTHELTKLKDNLPDGVWIRGYENRMDLFSIVILGPEPTCYVDGLFFFDLQIPTEFPVKPPRIHYVPYNFAPISPFISHDGAFCTSKLDMDFEEEPESYIASIISQIQELIFSDEPYLRFHEKQIETASPEDIEQSRAFNERVFLDVLTSCYNMAVKPYDPWKSLIEQHFASMIPMKIKTIKNWIDDFKYGVKTNGPGFNLFPVSDGFSISIESRLKKLEDVLTFVPSENIPMTQEINENMENDNEELCQSISSDQMCSLDVEYLSNDSGFAKSK